jgi:hypothetical protein
MLNGIDDFLYLYLYANLIFCRFERQYWSLSDYIFCLIIQKNLQHFLISDFLPLSIISKSLFVVSALNISKSVSRTPSKFQPQISVPARSLTSEESRHFCVSSNNQLKHLQAQPPSHGFFFPLKYLIHQNMFYFRGGGLY